MAKCNPVDFNKVSNRILNIPNMKNDSVFIRTAVGRSYYSAFLLAKELLEHKGRYVQDNKKVHKETIENVKLFNDFLGDQLDNLREERVSADYYMNEEFDWDRGNNCYELANYLIKELKEKLS